MNIGLLAGLGAGLQSLSTSMQKQQERDEEMAMAEKKAMLTRKLQMDILQAKQAYAEAHPEYKHFVATPSGDTMAFDEFGHSKRFEGTEADKTLAQQKVEGLNAYRNTQAAMQQALIAPKIEAMDAQAEANRARAKAAGMPKGKPLPPPNLVTPAQLSAIKTKMLKDEFGKEDPFPVDDATYQAAKEAEAAGKATTSQKQDIADYERAAAKRARIDSQINSFYSPMSPKQAASYTTPGLAAPQAGQEEEEAPDYFSDLTPDPNNPAGE